MNYPLCEMPKPCDQPVTSFKAGKWYKCTYSGTGEFTIGKIYLCIKSNNYTYFVTNSFGIRKVVELSSKFVEAT